MQCLLLLKGLVASGFWRVVVVVLVIQGTCAGSCYAIKQTGKIHKGRRLEQECKILTTSYGCIPCVEKISFKPSESVQNVHTSEAALVF